MVVEVSSRGVYLAFVESSEVIVVDSHVVESPFGRHGDAVTQNEHSSDGGPRRQGHRQEFVCGQDHCGLHQWRGCSGYGHSYDAFIMLFYQIGLYYCLGYRSTVRGFVSPMVR